jgi:hypothetical protein
MSLVCPSTADCARTGRAREPEKRLEMSKIVAVRVGSSIVCFDAIGGKVLVYGFVKHKAGETLVALLYVVVVSIRHRDILR